MGTRARVNVFDGDEAILSIYRQFDGYPEGLGQQVADFAADMMIVNGISGQQAGEAANGMGCFAAQLVCALKDKIGNVYIRDTSEESHGEEFSYSLREKGGRIWMDAFRGSITAFGNPGDTESDMKPIFSGFAKDFKVHEEAEA